MTLGHRWETQGTWFALSVAALAVGCSGVSTHELGEQAAGAGDQSGGTGGTGAVTGGKGGAAGKGTAGGTVGKGGTGGAGGAGGATGGSSTGGTGGDLVGVGGEPDGAGGSGAMVGSGDPSVALLRNPVSKLDVLLMVDNSIGMADKQALLANGMQMLLGRFTNPICVDASGASTGVADASGNCATGAPKFPPVRDVHVGVITSSLGDHGSGDVCSPAQNAANSGVASTYDDKAQLIPSVRPNSGDTEFLTWSPSGSDSLAEATGSEITAAGEHGCGYEAQLESWYRFLVDPEPVGSMGNDGSVSVRGAVNDVVLAQRAAFLRPDSALVIAMLTDENDCSIIDEDGEQGWLVGYKGGVGNLSWHMPRARAVCATNPNDQNCKPCLAGDTDPACAQGNNGTNLTLDEDSMNERCFQQTQRFGINLLYPTSRYVEALQSGTITPRSGGPQVPNPLFFNGANGVSGRSPGLVYFAGVVGVPWQDVVTDDTLNGGDFRYMTASELEQNGRWDVILGDPMANVLPTDPLMIESIDPRKTGAEHPLLANAAIAPSSSTTNANPINGHEQAVLPQRDDLQFACIYPLAHPLSAADCTAHADGCDCNADEFDKHSPLCEGVTADADGKQVYGKAYPGLRELEVLKGVGANSIVASACPTNVSSDDPPIDPSYGYNAAMTAIADRASEGFSYLCLPSPLPIDSDLRTYATVIEALPSLDPCYCDPAEGRLPPSDSLTARLPSVYSQLNNLGLDVTTECLCEIQQLSDQELQDCYSNGTASASEHGFCYLDADAGAGDTSLLQACAASQKRRIRFFGDGVPAANALTFLVYPDGAAPGTL